MLNNLFINTDKVSLIIQHFILNAEKRRSSFIELRLLPYITSVSTCHHFMKILIPSTLLSDNALVFKLFEPSINPKLTTHELADHFGIAFDTARRDVLKI